MNVKLITQDISFRRIPLGLWGVDRTLLGNKMDKGLPVPSMIELYGAEHTGKSTFAMYIAAKVAGGEEVVYCDFEGTTMMAPDYAVNVMRNAGFIGTLRFVDAAEKVKGKTVHRTHEAMFQETLERMYEPQVRVAIVDSIGMFTPATEKKKKLGERDVGQRPRTIADASREIRWILRETYIAGHEPKVFIFVNHTHPTIGGSGGFWTPGGVTKQAAADIRLFIRRRENDIPDGASNFLAIVQAQKMKIGGKSGARQAYLFFVPNYGISPEMTAIMDGVDWGVVDRKATVKVRDENGDMESIGYMSKLVDSAVAGKDKTKFKKVIEALEREEARGVEPEMGLEETEEQGDE